MALHCSFLPTFASLFLLEHSDGFQMCFFFCFHGVLLGWAKLQYRWQNKDWVQMDEQVVSHGWIDSFNGRTNFEMIVEYAWVEEGGEKSVDYE